MANSLYGSSASSIKQLQQLLNQKGAGLNVDGIWGPKTEAAFQQYGGSLGGSAATTATSGSITTNNKNQFGLNYLTYNSPSDEELYSQAQSALSGEYGAMYTAEEERARKLKASLERALADLEPAQEKRLAALENEYTKVRQQLNDEALKRGMGRSTHFLGMLADSSSEQMAAANEIYEIFRTSMDDINREIYEVERELEINKGMISQKKESALRQYMDQLRDKRDNMILDMVKYNNSVREKELSLTAQLNAAKSTGSGARNAASTSNKTSTTNSATTFTNTILTEWNRLTKAGKIATFDQIGEMVRKQNNSLYQELKKEVEKYKKEGIFAAHNVNYNFYTDTQPQTLYNGPR
ncbi:peptidoglycan-binding protein [Eubacteriales bacterium OttesenSCG-928-M02]|nr:peptidoglycan-binding protein [Eubacteriales bacterium OttesenSCG-928-M02]